MIMDAGNTPPTDDVREALAIKVSDIERRMIVRGLRYLAGYGMLREGEPAKIKALRERIELVEVRPRGTVTEAEVKRPYSEAVDIELGAWETDDIEERAHDLLAVVARRREEGR